MSDAETALLRLLVRSAGAGLSGRASGQDLKVSARPDDNRPPQRQVAERCFQLLRRRLKGE